MSEGTQRRSIIARTLVLIGAMFASGAAEKKVPAGEHRSKQQYAYGMGWGGSAVFSPRRGKFKGFMRSATYKKKHQR